MVKFIKCRVMMSQLRMAVLNASGEPNIIEKEDMFGNKYMETQEVTYRRGDTVSLPEAVIKKLGKSVAIVMVPQVDEPVVTEQEVPADGEIRDSGREKTIAEIIPKDKDDTGNDVKTKTSKGNGKGKGNK
jgi:hypothetical protein